MENTKTIQPPAGGGAQGARLATEVAPVGKILRVSKYAYNTIRSLVESSTKSSYWFNQPRFYLNTVKFVKEGRWVVEVSRLNDVETVVELYDRNGHSVLQVRFRGQEPQIEHVDGRRVTVPPNLVVLLPKEEVAFARPLNLLDVVERLLEYKEEAEILLKNKPEEVQ